MMKRDAHLIFAVTLTRGLYGGPCDLGERVILTIDFKTAMISTVCASPVAADCNMHAPCVLQRCVDLLCCS